MQTPQAHIDSWCQRQCRIWPSVFNLRHGPTRGDADAGDAIVSYSCRTDGTAFVTINGCAVAICDGCTDLLPVPCTTNRPQPVTCPRCGFANILHSAVRRLLGMHPFCAGLRFPPDVARFVVIEAIGVAASQHVVDESKSGRERRAASKEHQQFLESWERRQRSADDFLDFIGVSSHGYAVSWPECREADGRRAALEGSVFLEEILDCFRAKQAAAGEIVVMGAKGRIPSEQNSETLPCPPSGAGVVEALFISHVKEAETCIRVRKLCESSSGLARDAVDLWENLRPGHVHASASLESSLRTLGNGMRSAQHDVRWHMLSCPKCSTFHRVDEPATN